MVEIHSGFGRELNQLADQGLSAEQQKMQGGGVAYFDSSGKPIFKQVHFGVIGESESDHACNLEKFKTSHGLSGSYMGFGGLVNLSYVAVLKSPSAILCDVNATQTMFWRKLVELLATIPNPVEFRKNFSCFPGYIRHNIELLYRECAGGVVKGIEIRGFNTRSLKAVWDDSNQNFGDPDRLWFEDAQLYDHLHRMAKNDAISTITLDITDTDAFDQILKIMGRNDTEISHFYISNILHFLSHASGNSFSGRNISSGGNRAVSNLELLSPKAEIITVSPSNDSQTLCGKVICCPISYLRRFYPREKGATDEAQLISSRTQVVF